MLTGTSARLICLHRTPIRIFLFWPPLFPNSYPPSNSPPGGLLVPTQPALSPHLPVRNGYSGHLALLGRSPPRPFPVHPGFPPIATASTRTISCHATDLTAVAPCPKPSQTWPTTSQCLSDQPAPWAPASRLAKQSKATPCRAMQSNRHQNHWPLGIHGFCDIHLQIWWTSLDRVLETLSPLASWVWKMGPPATPSWLASPHRHSCPASQWLFKKQTLTAVDKTKHQNDHSCVFRRFTSCTTNTKLHRLMCCQLPVILACPLMGQGGTAYIA